MISGLQLPTKGQIAEVAAAAVALRGLRREIMAQLGYSVRKLDRTLEEPGANPLRAAHTRLDTTARAAYAMLKAAAPLAFLLSLNSQLAAREQTGEPITPPGIPLAEHQVFFIDDFVRVPQPASCPSRKAGDETAPLDPTRSGRPLPK